MHPHTADAPMPAAPRPNSAARAANRMVAPGVGPPTMAPWRRRGDSSTARWCWSAAGPRTSAAPRRCGSPPRVPRWWSATCRLEGARVGGRARSRRPEGAPSACAATSAARSRSPPSSSAPSPSSAASTRSTTTRPGATPASTPTPSAWISACGSGRSRSRPRGALLLARHAIPVMAAGGGGSIVTISSGTSTIGESTRVAYGVSKAALNQLTRHLAVRYGRDGIRANAIAPGFILTETAATQVPADVQAPPGRGQPDPAPRHTRRHRPRGGLPLQRRLGLRERPGAPRRRRAPDRRDDVGGRCLRPAVSPSSPAPAAASAAAPPSRWPGAASTS